MLPYVKEALVYEKDKKICAEVFLDEDETPNARDLLPAGIETVNGKLADYMQIQTFCVRNEPFEKTATLKIKRNYTE